MVLDILRHRAPHIANLQEHVDEVFGAHGIDPGHHQAAVLAAFDNSASTDLPPNRLWSSGDMQRIVDLLFAAAWTLDDDRVIPVSVFDSRVSEIGRIDPSTCQDCLKVRPKQNIHRATSYLAPLRWIVETAGYGRLDLGNGTGPLSVKATADYPIYAIVVTDGNPCEPLDAISAYVKAMSQLPIYVQLVSLGNDTCRVLPALASLPGRLVSNTNYFHADRVDNTGEMLRRMLGTFPAFYADAKRAGLIVG